MSDLLWEGTIRNGAIGARIYDGGRLRTFALHARNVEYEPIESEALLIWPAAFYDLREAAKKVAVTKHELLDAFVLDEEPSHQWEMARDDHNEALDSLTKKLWMDT